MGRAPRCEKMGLKKGPWTPEEDYVLINYIQQHGHANWRALPKQAGLLRCGKSCRLRWINYLRPDIKRGNFSEEEEDTIIKLHQMLGNRWSAIAAKLPGRTDNEIKNVWHTHLKKRLRNHYTSQDYSKRPFKNLNVDFAPCNKTDRTTMPSPASPEQSSTSELSSVTNSSIIKHEEMELSNDFLEIDESFWSEDPSLETLSVQCSEISVVNAEYSEIPRGGEELKFPIWAPQGIESVESWSENVDNGMDFWYNLFIRAGDIPELPEF